MPQIDVTPAIVAGANGLNAAATGYARGLQQKEDNQYRAEMLALAKQAAADRSALVDEQLNQAYDRREGKKGEIAALEYFARLRSNRYKPGEPEALTGDLAFWGDSDLEASSTYGRDEQEGLEKMLRAQREDIENAASGMSEQARLTFLRDGLPYLDRDENEEREALGARQVTRLLEEAGNSGLLDEGGMAVVQEAMQGLQSQQVTPGAAMSALRQAKQVAAKKLERQQNFQQATAWFEKNLQEVALSGDVKPLTKAYSDWLQTDDLDPQELTRRVLVARYGVDIKAQKIGDVTVTPEKVKLGSPQWNRIAQSEATRNAQQLVRQDPRIRYLAAEAAKNPELRSKFDKEYALAMEEAKDVEIASYAASWGASDEQIAGMLSPKRAKMMQEARAEEIRAKFAAAGLSELLDKPLSELFPKPKAPPTPVQREGANIPRPGAPAPSQPKPQVDPNDLNADGVYDEQDLLEAYGGRDGG